MRVIALLAVHNEERFLAGCIKHLRSQGVDTYVIDNSSTDRTREIAASYLGRGVIEIDSLVRDGFFDLTRQLERKSELAASLKADWFMHLDADEIRLPPSSCVSLRDALAEVDAEGYNAVNFQEFTFVPTKEAPDHDHPRFIETMRWYYPFLPSFPHRLNAWKRQEQPVDLASSGGHVIRYPGLRMSPISFPMRHYLFLSIGHALEKWGARRFEPAEVEKGWHGARAIVRPDTLTLPPESALRRYVSDDRLDPSSPLSEHLCFEHTP
jgi:hypothetical protein